MTAPRGRAKVEPMSREEEMFEAAEKLRFDYAAKLLHEIKELRRELAALTEASS